MPELRTVRISDLGRVVTGKTPCTVRKSVSERTVDVCRVRHWQEAIDPEAGLPDKCLGFTPLVRCAEAVAPQAAIRDSVVHQGQGI